MNDNKPFILISNDDGYHAKGLNSLIHFLADMADILVCAPEAARSGYSTAFSAVNPLRLKKRRNHDGAEIWSCNGTPVDCVKLALSELCPRRPDMVIGGINHGDNASVNSHYSGTMGVTREGCMKYIPSVAFSLCDYRDDADFEPLRPVIRHIVKKVLEEGLPRCVCLNVNFPLVDEYQGVRVCRMAKGRWLHEVSRASHPRGYEYYWLIGDYTNDEPEAEDTDNWALTHGYIAITPTTIDVTAYEAAENVRKWF
ncbi:MAG: 5'/3'-nucleotidase SurE [Prevotella sp.]|nr:5'/3'-nucleotidase SurE [Prevotella sp.]